MAEIGTDIGKAAELLTKGYLVSIPTETVYGLAGNALKAEVVAKIFEAKNRPQFDPLIIHVPDIEHAERYVKNIPEKARQLANRFWPGPLTLVLQKQEIIPDLVTSGLDTVGIRCPDHKLTHQLLEKLEFPLAAPSANPFGYISPTQAQHVNEQLGNKIDYILDGGPCPIGIESTIIGFEIDQPVIYRVGGLGVEDIQQEIGDVKLQTNASSNPRAPGQLKSHYAPGKKLILGNLTELLQQYPNHCSAILSFKEDYNSPHQFILSKDGDLQEAAQNLFLALRTLDKLDVDVILAELVPNSGLGRAINDRLTRAAVSNN
jgi:L-threonylcarbamoyladenylate synthase